MDLAGKVAVVTGGAMGIGFSACEALAAQGAAILIADMKDAAAAAKRLRDKGYKAAHADTDVSSESDTQSMAEIAMKQADAEVKKANAQAAVAGLQMEQQKLQAEHQLAMAKLALETAKVQAELQLKQDQLAHKVAVDAAEIALEQQVQETAAKSSITAVAAPTR